MPKQMCCFVVGVCVFHLTPMVPPLWLIVAGGLLVVCLWRPLPSMSAVLAGLVLASASATAVLADRWDIERHGEDIVVTGRVSSLPDGFAHGGRFLFVPDAGLHPDLPSRIRVSWFLEDALPTAGSEWRLALRIRAPRGTLNPGGFDYEQWLTARRIGATATVRPLPAPILVRAETRRDWLFLRAHIDNGLISAMGVHARRGIVRGLALGERGELGPEEWEVFARTGTAHLMAISGLHVGMVAATIFLLVGLLSRHIAVIAPFSREVGVIMGLLAATFYAALAGFAIPTRRALCMLSAAALLLVLRRQGLAFMAWIIAMVLVVATDPLAPLTIGFWLSFGAVGVITWAMMNRRGPAMRMAGLLRVQWAVAVGLAPMTLWFFQRGSLIAPVANLVAVPMFTVLVVPAVLGGALLSVLVPGLAVHWFAILGLLLDILWVGLEWLAALPFAQRFTAKPPLVWIVLATFGVCVMLLPPGLPGRFLFGLVLFMPMLCWTADRPSPGGWQLTVLEVGQGLAAVVRTESRVLVYDTGPAYGTGLDAGARYVVPYLRAQGIEKIDLLVVSHPHRDHDGGVDSVLDAFPGTPLMAGEDLSCHKGQSWQWDGVYFRMLHPTAIHHGRPNLVSCVLEVRSAAGSLLLPGDIEWPTELEMTQPGRTLSPVDVLVVAHHGSATSSTPRFLQRTRPRWALVPAGFANRWRFPNPEVVARLEQVGSNVMVVGEVGAVTVTAHPVHGVLAPLVERDQTRRWWRTLLSSAERGNG